MQEKRLQHRGEAEQFYRGLAGQEVRVGMEACGHYPWFERLGGVGHGVVVGGMTRFLGVVARCRIARPSGGLGRGLY
jgi:hypothetical protein